MLSNAIKQIAMQTVDTGVPMAIMHGQVNTVTPLLIMVDNRLPVSGNALILPRGMTLQAGEKVILLRNQGGQEYLVMGVES